MKLLYIELPLTCTGLQLFAISCLLTLSDLTNGQQTTCTQKTDCSCQFADGTIIDISSLGSKSGGPKFTYAKPDGQPSYFWEFAFNPCYKFTDSYCKDVVSCQRAADLTSSYRLGTETAIWSSDGTKVSYSSTGDDGALRTSVLTLECDETGSPSNPTFVVKGEDIDTPQQYDYTLKSVCACPDGCKGGGGGGGGSGGLSFGSILCIIFSVLVLVYIIGGMIFMKVVKGAEGKEIIPNVDLWMNFHNYVKDGVLFLKDKITGGSSGAGSGYEDI